MDYTKFYFKDYRHDTRGLDPSAHGIYLLLLFEFMESEKPLPSDMDTLHSFAEARTDKEKATVAKVLKRFWARLEDGWIQKLAFVAITDFRNGLLVKKSNGAGIGGKTKQKLEFTVAKRSLGDALAKCQRTGSDPLSDHYLITSDSLALLINQESGIKNQEPRIRNPDEKEIAIPPDGLTPERWADRIVAAYARNDSPMPCRESALAAIRGGEDPAVILESINRMNEAGKLMASGTDNQFFPTARSCFEKRIWKDIGAFEERCKANSVHRGTGNHGQKKEGAAPMASEEPSWNWVRFVAEREGIEEDQVLPWERQTPRGRSDVKAAFAVLLRDKPEDAAKYLPKKEMGAAA